MPNSVLRVLLALVALIAALLLAGVGAGVAGAEPDAPGSDNPNPSDTVTTADPQPVSEPQPTTDTLPKTVPTIFDIPNTIIGQLRDLLGRPLSIFGNGRVPGTHTVPGATASDGVPTNGSKRAKPTATPTAKPVEPSPPDPTVTAPVKQAPAQWKVPASAVVVTLPFSQPISVPVPDIPVPGHENTRWTLNLTNAFTAYASVQQTVTTVNSLLADAFAPYDPFTPPPKPPPTARILEEQPVVDSGGAGPVIPMSVMLPQLPVLQAPVVVAPVRLPSARPVAEPVPTPTQALGDGGAAGVRAPALRGSVAQTGSPPTEPSPPTGSTSALSSSGMANPALREGYPRYLRSARPNQVAVVAIPGLAGLIAITASGGVIGYRQANSGRYLRSDAARFLQ